VSHGVIGIQDETHPVRVPRFFCPPDSPPEYQMMNNFNVLFDPIRGTVFMPENSIANRFTLILSSFSATLEN
jgi:hypothetical protein